MRCSARAFGLYPICYADRPHVSYAEKLANAKGVALPAGYDRDFQACRFLDQHG